MPMSLSRASVPEIYCICPLRNTIRCWCRWSHFFKQSLCKVDSWSRLSNLFNSLIKILTKDGWSDWFMWLELSHWSWLWLFVVFSNQVQLCLGRWRRTGPLPTASLSPGSNPNRQRCPSWTTRSSIMRRYSDACSFSGPVFLRIVGQCPNVDLYSDWPNYRRYSNYLEQCN